MSNPFDYDVGSGVLEEATKQGWTIIGNERWAGGGTWSETRCMEGRIFYSDATGVKAVPFA